MPTAHFAPHELLELHEFLASEATGAQKLQAALGIIQDPDLKALMESSLSAKQRRINNMQKLISTTIGNMQ